MGPGKLFHGVAMFVLDDQSVYFGVLDFVKETARTLLPYVVQPSEDAFDLNRILHGVARIALQDTRANWSSFRTRIRSALELGPIDCTLFTLAEGLEQLGILNPVSADFLSSFDAIPEDRTTRYLASRLVDGNSVTSEALLSILSRNNVNQVETHFRRQRRFLVMRNAEVELSIIEGCLYLNHPYPFWFHTEKEHFFSDKASFEDFCSSFDAQNIASEYRLILSKSPIPARIRPSFPLVSSHLRKLVGVDTRMPF